MDRTHNMTEAVIGRYNKARPFQFIPRIALACEPLHPQPSVYLTVSHTTCVLFLVSFHFVNKNQNDQFFLYFMFIISLWTSNNSLHFQHFSSRQSSSFSSHGKCHEILTAPSAGLEHRPACDTDMKPQSVHECISS